MKIGKWVVDHMAIQFTVFKRKTCEIKKPNQTHQSQSKITIFILITKSLMVKHQKILTENFLSMSL